MPSKAEIYQKSMDRERELHGRIRDLETENKRLKAAIKLHVASQHILEDRAEAAEAKLAAVNDALESSDDYENFECWHGATLGSCGNERCLACNVYLAVKAPMPADPEVP